MAMPFNRRETLILGGGAMLAGLATPAAGFAAPHAGWPEEPMRWFQLAFTEDDPGRYDQAFWIDYFKQIHAQGACLSAGGGIAFYPTRVPGHGKASGLAPGMDPFGDMVKACKALGLHVLARIDPQAMIPEVAKAHPEWALRSRDGTIRRHGSAPDLTLTCCLGPYAFELMPQVIEEIARLYPVDGFFGNRWFGSDICYCASCREAYRAASGHEIPVSPDQTTAEGRLFLAWVEQRLFAVIDSWNRAARKYRPDAFLIPGSDRRALVELDGPELSRRLPLAFCDRQARSADGSPFSPGPEAWGGGRYTRELRAFMGSKPVGQIISVGVEEAYRWKDSVQSDAEIRIWAAGAIAQGARPWFAKFNAKPLDRRWMTTVRDIYGWHHANERYLRNESNLARVGLVVSRRTVTLLGGYRDRVAFEDPMRGFYQALLESRIPFDMIDEGLLDRASLARFDTLVLANVAVLSDAQCARLRAFVAGGGNLVATFQTSLFDEQARRRPDFGLADLFGCHYAGPAEGPLRNSYLTPRHSHAAMQGLADIERTIGAVHRQPVTGAAADEVALTFVAPYPDLPMERVYTSTTDSDVPMAICRTIGASRVAYLPMDLDRTFAALAHGDHLTLLRAIVEWTHRAVQPLQVTGPGLVDIAFWRQRSSVTAHLVNLNNPMTMRGSYREAIPTGPYTVRLAVPAGRQAREARLLVAGTAVPLRQEGGWITVEVPRIDWHEVVAVETV